MDGKGAAKGTGGVCVLSYSRGFPRYLSQPSKMPQDPGGGGGSWNWGGGMREVGNDKLLCPKFTSLENGVTDRAVPSKKPWLGSKVIFDLLTQPQTVGSCGHSGGCWWEHLLGKDKRVAGRGLFCPQPPASQRKPLWPLQDRPCFPSPTSLFRIEV